jgi:hypothetical protein
MIGRRLHVQPTVLFPGLWRTSNKYKLLPNKNYSTFEVSGYLYRFVKLWALLASEHFSLLSGIELVGGLSFIWFGDTSRAGDKN